MPFTMSSLLSSPVMNTALVSAIVSTCVLFIFHAFPLNTMVIEKNLAADKDSVKWWAAASLYYFVIFLVVSIPMQYMSRKWMCAVNK